MSHYRRANQAGATYFFTVVTFQRRAFLCNEEVLKALRDAIEKVRGKYPFTIDAWVILPTTCTPFGHYHQMMPTLPIGGD